jgi:hypothetical protein
VEDGDSSSSVSFAWSLSSRKSIRKQGGDKSNISVENPDKLLSS